MHHSLSFFVQKPQYPKTYFELKPGCEHVETRTDLAHHYGWKPIKVNGIPFKYSTIWAEPKKKSSLFESIGFMVLITLFLFILEKNGHEISTARYVIGNIFSFIFGMMLGYLRIDRQQVKANAFNNSVYNKLNKEI